MGVVVFPQAQHILLSLPTKIPTLQTQCLTRRKAFIFTSSLISSFIYTCHHSPATAFQTELPQQEEDALVHLFQETSPSVVFIKDLELAKGSDDSTKVLADDLNAKVQGTADCSVVSLVNAKGESIVKDAKIIGVDPAYDLAVLKVDVEGDEVKPVSVGTSSGLRVGQSCFAIGNPYGYENTLTTGVVSGLGREIPAPNGAAIKGAIQTDAAINAGNSGGPLIDSSGHVIGVNTATFTRRGSGMSSGVNFAIPIDTVVRTIPYLIVYGTSYKDRY